MIRVTIIDDKRIIGSVSDICSDDTLMAWAQENEKAPGYCIFTKSGEIKDVVDKDNIFELLIRATLNFLDRGGVKRGWCTDERFFTELKKLGFKETEGVCEVNTEEFFKPCCHKK